MNKNLLSLTILVVAFVLVAGIGTSYAKPGRTFNNDYVGAVNLIGVDETSNRILPDADRDAAPNASWIFDTYGLHGTLHD